MKKALALSLTFFFVVFGLDVFPCTITAAGKEATVDGSVVVSHSDDGLSDPRLIYVPAMDHKAGEQRAVYYAHYALDYKPEYGASQCFRLVTDDRGHALGWGYNNPDEAPRSKPLGYIPQAPHTFAYFDANYGVMNEFQVSIGECTDKAKVHPQPDQGKRIFYSAELSRVALERCKTAKDAVLLMGDLIKRYGYYGTGETLAVADTNEIWVMEMCGYDANGTDGVWVAQRVPDNGFFTAANQFRIREIRKDAKDLMYSENVFDVARNKGWWKPSEGDLDWTRVYGDGEFHHPYYSLRRVWRALSLVAPSLKLPSKVEGPFTKLYPFSVKPDKKIAVSDVFAIHRDNYEGTAFDLTKGMAAGPFGDPNRFEGGAESASDPNPCAFLGAFERPLNIYRCVYSYVNQSRKNLPDPIGGLSWFGEDRPATSVFIPFYIGIKDVPVYLQKANILKMERDSMWTAFNYVANYAMIKYSDTVQNPDGSVSVIGMYEDIKAERIRFESAFIKEQPGVERQAAELWKQKKTDEAIGLLTTTCFGYADSVLRSWWTLSESLYIKYNDGYINTPEEIGKPVFYPCWWLEAVGYKNGPLKY